MEKRLKTKILKSDKNFVSKFVWKEISDYDFDSKIEKLDLTDFEKKEVKKCISLYLKKFDKNYENMISGVEKEVSEDE